MADEEVLPEAKRQESAAAVTRRHLLPMLAAAGLGAIIISHFVPLSSLPPHSSDSISADEVQRRIAAFATMQPVKLKPVAPADRDAAMAALKLAPDQKTNLAQAVQDETVRLVEITLYDSDVEDGDAVTVSSNGLSVSLTLAKAPVTVAVPYPQNGFVGLTGIVDGEGGGVTVGIVTPSGPVPLPPMSVGQTLQLPVSLP